MAMSKERSHFDTAREPLEASDAVARRQHPFFHANPSDYFLLDSARYIQEKVIAEIAPIIIFLFLSGMSIFK